MSFQEELANALEALRTEREKNSKLESLNNHLQDELDRALHLLYLAENPQPVVEDFDADLPFTPDQE